MSSSSSWRAARMKKAPAIPSPPARPGGNTTSLSPAKNDAAPNEAQVLFRAGYDPQVIEIGGLQVLDFGPAVPLADLPCTPPTCRGREAEAPWRAAAAERIERLRKADLAIAVTRGGQPGAGAEVRVKMTRHAFGFGSAVDAKTLLQSGPDGDRYRAVIVENVNKVVLENDLIWPLRNPSPRR